MALWLTHILVFKLFAQKQQTLLEKIYSHSLVLPKLINGVKPSHLSVCPTHGVVWMKESEEQVEEELWAFKVLIPSSTVAECRHSVWTHCYGQNSMDMSTLSSNKLKKILKALDGHLKEEKPSNDKT